MGWFIVHTIVLRYTTCWCTLHENYNEVGFQPTMIEHEVTLVVPPTFGFLESNLRSWNEIVPYHAVNWSLIEHKPPCYLWFFLGKKKIKKWTSLNAWSIKVEYPMNWSSTPSSFEFRYVIFNTISYKYYHWFRNNVMP